MNHAVLATEENRVSTGDDEINELIEKLKRQQEKSAKVRLFLVKDQPLPSLPKPKLDVADDFWPI